MQTHKKILTCRESIGCSAISLKAAKEALLKLMPDSKAKALTAAELFEAAIVPSKGTGGNALRELLAEGKIQRIGKGINRDPFRYFKQDA